MTGVTGKSRNSPITMANSHMTVRECSYSFGVVWDVVLLKQRVLVPRLTIWLWPPLAYDLIPLNFALHSPITSEVGQN